MSREIIIEPYNADWPQQFNGVKEILAPILWENALAIEHIGSTAVHGLDAKDVIDVQVSVPSLHPGIISTLNTHGWRARDDYCDEFSGRHLHPRDLKKYYAREPKGYRRVHVHIRETGRFNHRFALLFRDFLRNDANACAQYLATKRAAAAAYPSDIDGYLAIKTPVFNLLYHLAELWAARTDWVEPIDATPA